MTALLADRRAVLSFAALLLLALNLRPAVASVPPLLETIRATIGLSHGAGGLLTTIPMLCMGVFPLAAASLAARVGIERALLGALVLIGLATALRLAAAEIAVLFASTLLAGFGIAAGQTLAAPFVKARFGRRAVLVLGLYSTVMTLGTAAAAGGTPALMRAFGGWPPALAAWAVPALLAALVWAGIAASPAAGAAASAAPAGSEAPWRTRRGWLIVLVSAANFGLFFCVVAWVPPLYDGKGWGAERAGLLLTVLMLFQIVGNLVFAALADRTRDRRPWFAASLGLFAAGFVGMAVAPLTGPLVWAALAGFGGGGFFPLALNLPIDYAETPVAVGRLNALAQSGGYLLAAPLPYAVGALRDATGDFVMPFLALAALCGLVILVALTFRPARS